MPLACEDAIVTSYPRRAQGHLSDEWTYRVKPAAARARRRLRLERTWPWADALPLAWQRLTRLPAIT